MLFWQMTVIRIQNQYSNQAVNPICIKEGSYFVQGVQEGYADILMVKQLDKLELV